MTDFCKVTEEIGSLELGDKHDKFDTQALLEFAQGAALTNVSYCEWRWASDHPCSTVELVAIRESWETVEDIDKVSSEGTPEALAEDPAAGTPEVPAEDPAQAYEPLPILAEPRCIKDPQYVGMLEVLDYAEGLFPLQELQEFLSECSRRGAAWFSTELDYVGGIELSAYSGAVETAEEREVRKAEQAAALARFNAEREAKVQEAEASRRAGYVELFKEFGVPKEEELK